MAVRCVARRWGSGMHMFSFQKQISSLLLFFQFVSTVMVYHCLYLLSMSVLPVTCYTHKRCFEAEVAY